MTIPEGYCDVDPRTAQRIPLTLSLRPDGPLYPGDPEYAVEVAVDTRDEPGGYLVERITSLGAHTATHVSVPGHLIRGGALLDGLDEALALMPLVVIDVRAMTDPAVTLEHLQAWERTHGPIPAGACVALLTGASRLAATDPERYVAADVPGLDAKATRRLFNERNIVALASDSLSPDPAGAEELPATTAALTAGGITVENLGPGLEECRPRGDWIAINANRPALSGFPAGATAFTLPS